MRILDVTPLAIPDVLVIRFHRFTDARGSFCETYRRSILVELPAFRDVAFVQANESHSRRGVVRGLHFQWNPHMGKLVRTIAGRMIDFVCDIRQGSPTYGRCVAHAMAAGPGDTSGEWIWVPPGFAHGNVYTEDTVIEYLCSGEYSPECEASISPLAADLDWSLTEVGVRREIETRLASPDLLLADRDRAGHTLASWRGQAAAGEFVYAG